MHQSIDINLMQCNKCITRVLNTRGPTASNTRNTHRRMPKACGDVRYGGALFAYERMTASWIREHKATRKVATLYRAPTPLPNPPLSHGTSCASQAGEGAKLGAAVSGGRSGREETIPTPDTGKGTATEHTACSSGHFSLVTFSLGQQRESDPDRGSGSEARGRRASARRRDNRAIRHWIPACAGMTKFGGI
ncbi:hypothetical protein SAMN05216570_3936 [Dyella sp. OK004]|nr:hypothetical protein SAMN05216570_3936 [Dyella sp. OK004]